MQREYVGVGCSCDVMTSVQSSLVELVSKLLVGSTSSLVGSDNNKSHVKEGKCSELHHISMINMLT